MKKTITLLVIILCSLKGMAGHIAGGEITYKHLSGNLYQVNLNLFVDCLGFDPGATQTINCESTCGDLLSFNVSVTNPTGTEISQICPSQLGNTTCNGGTLPGMWLFKFTDSVTFPSNCDLWKMSWTTCCRNGAILNLDAASSHGSYIQSTLYNVTDSSNSSPYFTAQTIPYVCVGQPVNYNCGVVEPEGDSVYFSMINAKDAGYVDIPYVTGYSATSPIPESRSRR